MARQRIVTESRDATTAPRVTTKTPDNRRAAVRTFCSETASLAAARTRVDGGPAATATHGASATLGTRLVQAASEKCALNDVVIPGSDPLGSTINGPFHNYAVQPFIPNSRWISVGGAYRIELDCSHCRIAQGLIGSGAVLHGNVRGYFRLPFYVSSSQ